MPRIGDILKQTVSYEFQRVSKQMKVRH